jgi:uncharacterized surface protein with fasciclin (FAS1) repeats
MMNRYFVLTGALATSLFFAACQPRTIADPNATMSPQSSTLPDTTGAGFDSYPDMASASPAANLEGGVMVGGAMMLPSRTIAENVIEATNLTTLVAALKQAELVETLMGEGPYTVFAPTNAAFEKLPAGTVQGWMQPAQKAALTNTLKYHVVPGVFEASQLTNGMKLKTVEGSVLTVVVSNGQISLKDADGTVAKIETADVRQRNGIVHVIDGVLIP